MGRIETGVDKLVALVHDKKKISIDAAAKQLGVSKLVVTEWAEFLSDEKLVSIDYSLSKTYLKERELSKKDIEKREKQYSNKKEAFVRRVDSALGKLEQQEGSFEHVRQQFDDFKKSLGKQVDQVRGELQELEKFEQLKSKLDEDIQKEMSKYKDQVSQASSALRDEQKRYESLLGDIEKEKKTLDDERKRLTEVEEIEKEFDQRAEAVAKLLDRARKRHLEEQKTVQEEEKHVERMRSQADDLRTAIDKTKKERLDTLEDRRKEHEKAIEELRGRILSKASEAKKAVGRDVEAGTEQAKKFEEFFSKKMDVDKDIEALRKEKKQLEAGLQEMREAATSFNLASSQDVSAHVKELEKRFADWEKKREKHEGKLKKLVSGIFK